MLLSRLKQLMEEKYRVVDQEHEITDEQIEIEAALQARAAIEQQRAFHSHNPDYSAEGPEPEPETLPMPAAIVHSQMQSSGKRTKPGNSCEYNRNVSSSRGTTREGRFYYNLLSSARLEDHSILVLFNIRNERDEEREIIDTVDSEETCLRVRKRG